MAQRTAKYDQNSKVYDNQKVPSRKIDLAAAGLHPFIFKDITQIFHQKTPLILLNTYWPRKLKLMFQMLLDQI